MTLNITPGDIFFGVPNAVTGGLVYTIVYGGSTRYRVAPDGTRCTAPAAFWEVGDNLHGITAVHFIKIEKRQL